MLLEDVSSFECCCGKVFSQMEVYSIHSKFIHFTIWHTDFQLVNKSKKLNVIFNIAHDSLLVEYPNWRWKWRAFQKLWFSDWL